MGTLAALLTTFSFLPQAIKVIKTKDTKGISLVMYNMFVLGVFCWLVYGIQIKDLPVILANFVTFIFASIILIFKIKYKDKPDKLVSSRKEILEKVDQ
ncbi:SemiSWEET transporter [Clostridium sp. DJ247]|uniref:SemiSWEET transporter n=1 Tax=Clostridium sp. DJ247 TaxID=2726188 RepID=UPI0016284BA9|nr:SemiSWEET transporter [Clostridium sp. DJ247]MBC2579528.1 SemiSWEET transporter [Clostridium sp. DJ247]